MLVVSVMLGCLGYRGLVPAEAMEAAAGAMVGDRTLLTCVFISIHECRFDYMVILRAVAPLVGRHVMPACINKQ